MNQSTLEFKFKGQNKKFTFYDMDSSLYKKYDGWEKEYVDNIESRIGAADFIFISQHEEVLQELSNRNIPFVVVSPDNSDWISDTERQIIKQQWFGRIASRDNSFLEGRFNTWFTAIKENYDILTSVEYITKHNPVSFFLLKENQYISDIINELYWKKETYSSDYCKNI